MFVSVGRLAMMLVGLMKLDLGWLMRRNFRSECAVEIRTCIPKAYESISSSSTGC